MTWYKVGIDHPDFPQGYKFEVPSVGKVLPNKDTVAVELTDEQVDELLSSGNADLFQLEQIAEAPVEEEETHAPTEPEEGGEEE